MTRKEQEIGALNHQLCVYEKRYDDSIAAGRELKKEVRELKMETKKAEEVIKKKDEEIVSLHQSLHAQKEETEQMQASFDPCKESSGLSTEARWQNEVQQLKELLTERDQELTRLLVKRHACTLALLDTFAQLTLSQQRCDSLQEQVQEQLAKTDDSEKKELSEKVESLKKELAERTESFRMELSRREESYRNKLTEREESLKKALSDRDEQMRRQLSQPDTFQKELSDRLLTSGQELSARGERWEKRAQQWGQEKRELEEMLLVKEKVWQHNEEEMKEDFSFLTQKNIQLRVHCLSLSFGY